MISLDEKDQLLNAIFGIMGIVVEFFLIAFNLKEVCGVLDFKKIWKKKNSQHAFIDVRYTIQKSYFGVLTC